MDPQDLKSLQILEEIDNTHSPSQRYLANKLNISLGLANSFIKRLARKGYVKITTIPRNKVRYILTPQGFAEKSRLTYEFIQYSLSLYKEAMKKVRDLLNDLERKNVKKVVFYGVNDLAEIASISLKTMDIDLVGVVDDSKHGRKFLDFTIRTPAELREMDFDRIIITGLASKEPMVERLDAMQVPKEKIVTLD